MKTLFVDDYWKSIVEYYDEHINDKSSDTKSILSWVEKNYNVETNYIWQIGGIRCVPDILIFKNDKDLLAFKLTFTKYVPL